MTSLPPDNAISAPLVCTVIENRSANSAKFHLKLLAIADIKGRFSLAVRKWDASGSALMQQSGDFALFAGASEYYGHVALNVAVDSQIVADGIVTYGDTTVTCQLSREYEL